MKMLKKITYLLFISVGIFSCNEEEIATETTIAGKWNVTQTIGGFSQPKNYDYGTFTWQFDMDKKTVTIINTADVFTTKPISTFINNRGGVYDFKIEKEKGIDFLVVGNRKAPIKLEQNKLTLDYGVAFDDIGYIFKR